MDIYIINEKELVGNYSDLYYIKWKKLSNF